MLLLINIFVQSVSVTVTIYWSWKLIINTQSFVIIIIIIKREQNNVIVQLSVKVLIKLYLKLWNYGY